jgi:hypothetical protein
VVLRLSELRHRASTDEGEDRDGRSGRGHASAALADLVRGLQHAGEEVDLPCGEGALAQPGAQRLEGVGHR